MRGLAIAAAALLLFVPRTRADGTIATAELLRQLSESNPKLERTLRQGFDLDKDALGGSIGTAINPRLGGMRIGPYKLRGRLRGLPGALDLVITLNTEVTFLNAEGQKTTKIADASSVKEAFKSFQVEMLQ